MDEKKFPGDRTAFEPVRRVGCSDGDNLRQRSTSMVASDRSAKSSQKMEEAPKDDGDSFNEKERRQKISSILLAVKLRNYDELASLATSYGGFIGDETRRIACACSDMEAAMQIASF